jgi:hypothetical protein
MLLNRSAAKASSSARVPLASSYVKPGAEAARVSKAEIHDPTRALSAAV